MRGMRGVRGEEGGSERSGEGEDEGGERGGEGGDEERTVSLVGVLQRLGDVILTLVAS